MSRANGILGRRGLVLAVALLLPLLALAGVACGTSETEVERLLREQMEELEQVLEAVDAESERVMMLQESIASLEAELADASGAEEMMLRERVLQLEMTLESASGALDTLESALEALQAMQEQEGAEMGDETTP